MRFLNPFRRDSAKPAAGKSRKVPARAPQTSAARKAKYVFLLATGIGATGGAYYVQASGLLARETTRAHEAILHASADLGFRLKDITVEGRARTQPEQILAALDIERGAPILSLSLAEARGRLLGLPWVKSAVLERRLPDSLHLKIEERTPIALWQKGNRFVLIDADGVAIEADKDGHFAHLPVVVGDGAPRHAADLLAALAAEPELAVRVKAAVRVSDRRWNLRLDDIAQGTEIRLPEEDLPGAWSRLARLQREHRLLDNKLASIDLRYPDRLVIKPGAAERANVHDGMSGATPPRAERRSGKEA